MKKLIITLLLINSYIIKSQTWEWAKLIQPFDNRSGMGVMVSPYDGYLYGGGGFNQSINLGNSQSISGNNDGFIAKFDTAGLCQWTQHIYVTTQGCGCTIQGNTSGAGVVGFDSGGNIIVAGSYCGCQESYGSGFTSGPGYTLFLAKYNSSGVCQWVKTKAGSFDSSTGDTYDMFDAITIDASDNIYISMFNYATPTSFCGLTFANKGEYLCKINTNGVGVWNKQTATTTSGYSILQMKYFNKRIYASTQYTGVCTFGTYTYTSQGSTDVTALKMDTSGNVLTAANIAGTGTDLVNGLAVSNNRVVVLAQSGANTITIGTNTLSTNGSKGKTFLVAYDTTSLTVQNYTNTANDSLGAGVALYNDFKGNIYATVTNSGTTGFGSLSSVAAGRHVIKMDNTLTNAWHMESVGGVVAPDFLGNLYIVDSFTTSATYGSITETATNGIVLAKIHNAFTTSIDEGRMAAKPNNLSVYPNPGDGLFNLKINQPIKSKRNIVVTLYDNTGRQIDNIPFTQTDDYTLQINLTAYAQGLYMVKTEIDNVLYTAKLER